MLTLFILIDGIVIPAFSWSSAAMAAIVASLTYFIKRLISNVDKKAEMLEIKQNTTELKVNVNYIELNKKVDDRFKEMNDKLEKYNLDQMRVTNENYISILNKLSEMRATLYEEIQR